MSFWQNLQDRWYKRHNLIQDLKDELFKEHCGDTNDKTATKKSSLQLDIPNVPLEDQNEETHNNKVNATDDESQIPLTTLYINNAQILGSNKSEIQNSEFLLDRSRKITKYRSAITMANSECRPFAGPYYGMSDNAHEQFSKTKVHCMHKIEEKPPTLCSCHTEMEYECPSCDTRYQEDKVYYWGVWRWCEYIFIAVIGFLLMILALILTLHWGLSIQEKFDKALNLHPIFMIAGLITLNGLSTTCHLNFQLCFCCTRLCTVSTHIVLQIAAVGCTFFGTIQILGYHQYHHDLKYVHAAHTWLAYFALLLYFLQLVVGVLNMVVIYECECICFKNMRFILTYVHIILGYFVFIMALIAALTGFVIRQQYVFSPFRSCDPELLSKFLNRTYNYPETTPSEKYDNALEMEGAKSELLNRKRNASPQTFEDTPQVEEFLRTIYKLEIDPEHFRQRIFERLSNSGEAQKKFRKRSPVDNLLGFANGTVRVEIINSQLEQDTSHPRSKKSGHVFQPLSTEGCANRDVQQNINAQGHGKVDGGKKRRTRGVSRIPRGASDLEGTRYVRPKREVNERERSFLNLIAVILFMCGFVITWSYFNILWHK